MEVEKHAFRVTVVFVVVLMYADKRSNQIRRSNSFRPLLEVISRRS
jgi:hypothetical protein